MSSGAPQKPQKDQKGDGKEKRATWITLTEAVFWIAEGRLAKQAEPGTPSVAPEVGWLMPLDGLIEALERRLACDRAAIRAERRQRHPARPHGWAPEIRRLCRELSVDRAGLLVLARQQQQEAERTHQRWTDACRRLLALAGTDPPRVRMIGQATGKGAAEPIPFTVFHDPAISVTRGDRLGTPDLAALDWRQVKVCREDLMSAFRADMGKHDRQQHLAERMLAMQQTSRPRMKRATALLRLREDARCSDAEAREAWSALPSELRGARGKRPV